MWNYRLEAVCEVVFEVVVVFKAVFVIVLEVAFVVVLEVSFTVVVEVRLW